MRWSSSYWYTLLAQDVGYDEATRLLDIMGKGTVVPASSWLSFKTATMSYLLINLLSLAHAIATKDTTFTVIWWNNNWLPINCGKSRKVSTSINASALALAEY